MDFEVFGFSIISAIPDLGESKLLGVTGTSMILGTLGKFLSGKILSNYLTNRHNKVFTKHVYDK